MWEGGKDGSMVIVQLCIYETQELDSLCINYKNQIWRQKTREKKMKQALNIS